MTLTARPVRAPAADDAVARLRLTSRLTAAYILDAVSISRCGADLLDALLASAIIQANVAEIAQHADLQLSYAETDAMAPDDIRRPVSMNAIATSLGLPFETVRRRVTAMVSDDFCRFVDGGVIVPAEVLAQPQYYVAAFQGYERLRAFYYQLRDLDLLQDLPPPTVALSADTFPVRAVSRLVGAYILRIVEALGAAGNLVEGNLIDAMIMLEVFRSNVEHLTPAMTGGEMVVDRKRAPVAISVVARRLGLPNETVRRRVGQLVDRGACVRERGGLIIPTRVLAHPTIAQRLAGNAANLHRLFGSLARLGVLQVWDRLPSNVESFAPARRP